MKTVALLTPAVLSLLVLGAHYLRHSDFLMLIICLAVIALLFLRHRLVAVAIPAFLLFAAFSWARTLDSLVEARIAQDQTWFRMAIILGAVIVLNLLAILAFQTKTLRQRYGKG